MRLALLCEKKYVALVNNFGDSEKTCSLLEGDGAINVRSIYDSEKQNLAGQEDATLASGNSIGVANRMDNFFEAKKDNEMESILGEKMHLINEGSTAPSSPNSDPVSYKKSLAESIKDDSDIDLTRMIDPNYGTAGLHEFVPATTIKGMEDFVFESDHYR